MAIDYIFVFFELMDLQSRFATDDRFRMDSRFLESDSEEEQEGKCLIVQTVPISELGQPKKKWRNSVPQDIELRNLIIQWLDYSVLLEFVRAYLLRKFKLLEAAKRTGISSMHQRHHLPPSHRWLKKIGEVAIWQSVGRSR